MKGFASTFASKRLWVALAAALGMIANHKWWEAAAVGATYIAGESWRPTQPKTKV